MIIYWEKTSTSGNRESWAKTVSAVNRNLVGAKALTGSYLKSGENDLPIGTIVVEIFHEGSVKNGWQEMVVKKVSAEGLVDLSDGISWRKKFFSALDEIEKHLSNTTGEDIFANFSNEQILAEAKNRGLI